MRSYNGQLSDNQPIRRSFDEKQKQLRELKETLASMKPQASASLRESIRRRIGELQVELREAERKRAEAASAPPATETRRRPRRPERSFDERPTASRSDAERILGNLGRDA